MYNVIHGEPAASTTKFLRSVLGNPLIGRFRDISVVKRNGEMQIMLLTRDGGNNRECDECGDESLCSGCIQTRELPRHPLYIEDRDARWDHTYAETFFHIPSEHLEACAKLLQENNDDDDDDDPHTH